ncbi:MAG: hypothetical protein KC546_11825 [Anaerolineae bacterium]|nr:hypothetical protein [Anaerolineae bacterium]
MKIFWIVCLVALLFGVPVLAQESTCTVPSEEIISTVVESCADLEGNVVCYGQPDLEVIVDCERAPSFEAIGQTMSLEGVCTARTTGDGIAVFNLQPEMDSLTLITIGDVEMQNVASNDAGTTLPLLADSDVYSGPGSHFDVLASLTEGTEVFINACNCTHNWLRIVRDGGEIGWIPTRRVDIDDSLLPEVTAEEPLYDNMQNFLLTTAECGGVLIQMHEAPVPVIINGVTVTLDSTAYVRAGADSMEIDLLDGQGHISNGERTVYAPAGAHILIPLDEHRAPTGDMTVELYEPEHIASIPLGLVPQSIDPFVPLDATHPTIVGVEECNVVSNLADEACPVQFINPDGDDIVSLEVEFVYAAIGEWEESIHEVPMLLNGTMRTGVLGWDVSCSLGAENFIGPVEWLLTLEDAAGNRSEPFLAAFNCVDGK